MGSGAHGSEKAGSSVAGFSAGGVDAGVGLSKRAYTADYAFAYLGAADRLGMEKSWKLQVRIASAHAAASSTPRAPGRALGPASCRPHVALLQGIILLYQVVFVAIYSIHPIWGYHFSWDNPIGRWMLRIQGHGWARVSRDERVLVSGNKGVSARGSREALWQRWRMRTGRSRSRAAEGAGPVCAGHDGGPLPAGHSHRGGDPAGPDAAPGGAGDIEAIRGVLLQAVWVRRWQPRGAGARCGVACGPPGALTGSRSPAGSPRWEYCSRPCPATGPARSRATRGTTSSWRAPSARGPSCSSAWSGSRWPCSSTRPCTSCCASRTASSTR